MDLSAVMDAIAGAITDAGILDRAYPYPADSVTVPCAVVGYPAVIDFDMTMRGGSDRAEFPVYLLVGKPSEKSARDRLAAFVKNATGIKSVLDGDLGGTVQSARLTDLKVETVTVSGVDFLSATGTVEVVA